MPRKSSNSSDRLAIEKANDAPRSISLGSSSFQANQPIPGAYSEYGAGLSPELHWDRVPDNAQSLVLLVEDPDAPQQKPFVHWVMYNIPPSVHELPESLPRQTRLQQLGGAMQGRSSTGEIGYFGPRPPKDHGAHRYHFELFALDAPLGLSPGAERDEVVTAMKGHVVACGDLVGTFAPPREA